MRWTSHCVWDIRRYDAQRHIPYSKKARRTSRRNNREPEKNQQNPRLPGQSHQQDIPTRAERPTFHNFVGAAAFSLRTNDALGVVLPQSKFFTHSTTEILIGKEAQL